MWVGGWLGVMWSLIINPCWLLQTVTGEPSLTFVPLFLYANNVIPIYLVVCLNKMCVQAYIQIHTCVYIYIYIYIHVQFWHRQLLQAVAGESSWQGRERDISQMCIGKLHRFAGSIWEAETNMRLMQGMLVVKRMHVTQSAPSCLLCTSCHSDLAVSSPPATISMGWQSFVHHVYYYVWRLSSALQGRWIHLWNSDVCCGNCPVQKYLVCGLSWSKACCRVVCSSRLRLDYVCMHACMRLP
jgi:hypothetical protein